MKFKTFVIVTVIGLFGFSCGSSAKLKMGDEIITNVEKFKKKKGRLPESLSEIGIAETESGPIYYRKENESKYILWFGKELGESTTYDSDNKKWE